MNQRQSPGRRLYGQVLRLYPARFRAEFEQSMLQNVDDLMRDWQRGPAKNGLYRWLWLMADALAGVGSEHVMQIRQGDAMKTMLNQPRFTALITLLLALPLALIYVALAYDIELFAIPLTRLLTVDGQQINGLGRLLLLSSLLLLPVAFGVNLWSMVRSWHNAAIRTGYAANLLLGIALFWLLVVTWGGLILEQVRCISSKLCD